MLAVRVAHDFSIRRKFCAWSEKVHDWQTAKKLPITKTTSTTKRTRKRERLRLIMSFHGDGIGSDSRGWITFRAPRSVATRLYHATGGDLRAVRGRYGPAILRSISVSATLASTAHGGQRKIDRIGAKQWRWRRSGMGVDPGGVGDRSAPKKKKCGVDGTLISTSPKVWFVVCVWYCGTML